MPHRKQNLWFFEIVLYPINQDEELLKVRTEEPTEEINRNDLEGKHIGKVEPTKEYTCKNDVLNTK